MGWIRVDEPFAAAPKLGARRATSELRGDEIEIDRGLAELTGVAVDDQTLELGDATDVALDGCSLTNTHLELGPTVSVEIVACEIDGCDLSQVDVGVVRRTRFVDTKLVGTDFSGAALTDVVFENCVLRMASFRMTTLSRVRFDGCTIDDVDCYDATLSDVEFEASRLNELSVDRVDATRVDLRGATALGLKGVQNLSGFLVDESQLIGLAPMLAAAVGLDIERRVDDPIDAVDTDATG